MDEVRRADRTPARPPRRRPSSSSASSSSESGASALEGSLASLRGDKFGDEQKKLDEVMNELADVAKDQDDIAAEANRIFEAYAQKADEVARDHRREASEEGQRARRQAAASGSTRSTRAGLTPFAKEELDIVERRLADVEHMVGDGDLAEGARRWRARRSSRIDTIAGELEAAINDDPKSKWADATQDALDGVEHAAAGREGADRRARRRCRRKPDQIMSADDQQRDRSAAPPPADEPQRAQEARRPHEADRRATCPAMRRPSSARSSAPRSTQMGKADDRMKGRDPSGARESATGRRRGAREGARPCAQRGAPGAGRRSVSDEPIRIPGADEYKAPERFREDVLEAMRKGTTPRATRIMHEALHEELIK